MEVTVEAAQSTIADLIDKVIAGAEVTITRHGKAVAKLVPISLIEERRFKVGILKDLSGTEPDFFEPMTEEEMALWEGDEHSR